MTRVSLLLMTYLYTSPNRPGLMCMYYEYLSVCKLFSCTVNLAATGVANKGQFSRLVELGQHSMVRGPLLRHTVGILLRELLMSITNLKLQVAS